MFLSRECFAFYKSVLTITSQRYMWPRYFSVSNDNIVLSDIHIPIISKRKCFIQFNKFTMKEDHFCYFAYGSNISSSTLRKYCPTAEKICIAKLNDYRLDFQFWATIVPDKNKHVWGVVWLIHNRDIPQLDYYEDVDNKLYRVIHVTVESELPSGTPHTCRCYEMLSISSKLETLSQAQNVNTQLQESQKPATWYMRNIIHSSIESGIPEYYIAELKSVPTIECAFKE